MPCNNNSMNNAMNNKIMDKADIDLLLKSIFCELFSI